MHRDLQHYSSRGTASLKRRPCLPTGLKDCRYTRTRQVSTSRHTHSPFRPHFRHDTHICLVCARHAPTSCTPFFLELTGSPRKLSRRAAVRESAPHRRRGKISPRLKPRGEGTVVTCCAGWVRSTPCLLQRRGCVSADCAVLEGAVRGSSCHFSKKRGHNHRVILFI